MSAKRLWIGSAFIFAGVLFLLNTLGFLGWGIWWRLLDFWPVIIISIGVTMIFSRSRLAVLGPMLLVAVTAFIALTPGNYMYGLSPLEKSVREPLTEGIESGSLTFDLGAGQIRLSSGSNLFQANIGYVGSAPIYDFHQAGNTGVIRVDSAPFSGARIFNFRPDERLYSDVNLNSTIPWDLDLDFGAIDLEADLRDVPVKSLSLDVGAGKVDLLLGDSGTKSTIRLDSGVAKVYISVPRHVGLRVNLDTGLTANNLDDAGLVKRGDDWVSPDWDSATSSYDINLSTGIGKVDIVRTGPGSTL